MARAARMMAYRVAPSAKAINVDVSSTLQANAKERTNRIDCLVSLTAVSNDAALKIRVFSVIHGRPYLLDYTRFDGTLNIRGGVEVVSCWLILSTRKFAHQEYSLLSDEISMTFYNIHK